MHTLHFVIGASGSGKTAAVRDSSADDHMMRWAKYLIAETKRVGGVIIDNDGLSIRESASALARIVGEPTKEAKDSA